MADNDHTLYDVLRVKNNVKATEITRAYNRIVSELKQETAAPNPRLAAQAKVAFETLSDPDKRDEYDALLRRRLLTGQSQKHRPYLIGAGVAAGVALLWGVYALWHAHALEEAAKPKPLAAGQLVQAVAPILWHVDGAMMSGEVRDLGTAIATADGKLAMPCQGLVGGMILTVKAGIDSDTAELANPNEAVGVCVLKAKGATAGLKTRNDLPGAQEALEAVFVNATGKPETRKVSGAQRATDPAGPALEVKAAVPLPNGAAIFDAYGRLAGIVVAPHAASEGAAFAMSPLRLTQAKGVQADQEYVEPSQPVRPASPPREAAPAQGQLEPRKYKTRAEAEAAHRNAMEEELDKVK
jgi:hypothetical protein